MEITYGGGASFQIKGDRQILLNPVGRAGQNDIVLHNSRRKDARQIVNGPGEYEIGGVLIISVESRSADRRLNHAVSVGDINVICLGTTEGIEAAEIEALGRADILLLPTDNLAGAERMIKVFEPRVTLPYGPHAAELCTAMGIKKATVEGHFAWNGLAKVPVATLLRPAGNGKKAA